LGRLPKRSQQRVSYPHGCAADLSIIVRVVVMHRKQLIARKSVLVMDYPLTHPERGRFAVRGLAATAPEHPSKGRSYVNGRIFA
jgi:hypothetical protein